MKSQGYLLLVEDDPAIQARNKALLDEKQHPLRQALTLAAASSIIAAEGMPRAIILDVMLPDGNGFDFLLKLRETSNVPVLMLTAEDTQEDILRGLTAGGDYYLTKPCPPAIFLSHVEALLRRSALLPEIVVLGPIKCEPSSGKAFVNNEEIVLSQKEFALLLQFVSHPGKILLATDLYKKVWGQEMFPEEYSLSSAIYRLRKKLSDSGYTITSEYKEGYILEQG
ncbi:MAG: response regulator transcription factor [Oscillospiraceae bacterium]|nr:response regulator transcription factor [Oscillospiraceae bacterium]